MAVATVRKLFVPSAHAAGAPCGIRHERLARKIRCAGNHGGCGRFEGASNIGGVLCEAENFESLKRNSNDSKFSLRKTS